MLASRKALHSVAIHEAGHAVVSIALKRRFRYVTIQPQGESAGHVQLTPRRTSTTVLADFDFLIRALAGHAAEREFGYRPQRDRWQEDRRAADDHACEMSGSIEEARLWMRLATLRSRTFVRQLRPSIEALADRLMVAGVLDYQAAKSIVDQTRGLRQC
jgi:hypothetical protein